MPRPIIGFDTKNFFVEDQAAKLDDLEGRALARIGAFDRRTMRGLFRRVGKRGNPSKPGRPPKDRDGSFKRVQFLKTKTVEGFPSVITGVILFNNTASIDSPDVKTVMELHDKGGRIRAEVNTFFDSNQDLITGQFVSSREIVSTEVVDVVYPDRPFTLPTLEKNRAKRAEAFENTYR